MEKPLNLRLELIRFAENRESKGDFKNSPDGERQNQEWLSRVRRWAPTVVHIRQTSYDELNNVGYCSAEFNHHVDFDFDMLVIGWRRLKNWQGVCERDVDYKIEATLDDPGSPYVTWECHQ